MLSLVLSLLSCTKTANINTPPCYDCQIQRRDQTWYHETHCTNREDTLQFSDANGNSLQSICVPK